MASGLPVVAYEAEGVRDTVRHGETGLLAQAGDTALFTRSIGELLGDRERRARMSAAARMWAARRKWPSVLDRLLETYQRVIDERHFTGAAQRRALTQSATALSHEKDHHGADNVA